MSDDEALSAVVLHWMVKAGQALAAARREYLAGDLDLVINRVHRPHKRTT